MAPAPSASGRSSAGIVLYRLAPTADPTAAHAIEVLLGHMGGPFWTRKDEGAWTIPKGEHGPDDDPFVAARREFREETGAEPPTGHTLDLGEVRQSGGKRVRAWAIEGDLDVATAVSNTFEIEWPPRSGRRATFPEIDRWEWFDLDQARSKVVRAQVELLDRLAAARPR